MSDFSSRAESIVQFWEKNLLQGEIRPTCHQARRIYRVIEDGLQRALFADVTGSGKTLVSVAIKGLLDRKLGRKTKALLIGPEQALQTAWTQEEWDRYSIGLDLPSQQ